MSSEAATEREDSNEEIMSFDLGPEQFDPLESTRTHTWGFGTQSDGIRSSNSGDASEAISD